jgi:hypothetical protein
MNSENKKNFENKIKSWVSLDNEIKILNERLKELREDKKELSLGILSYARENNFSNSTIQISDGKLRFVNTKIQQPLTFNYLEKSMSDIIKNEDQVKRIIDHIKNSRENKTIFEIKRF